MLHPKFQARERGANIALVVRKLVRDFFGTFGDAISILSPFRSATRKWQRDDVCLEIVENAWEQLVGAGRFELPTPGPPERELSFFWISPSSRPP